MTFKAVDDRVIITVGLGTDRMEQVNGMVQMGEMQAGEIISNNQKIEFNITHDKTVEQIVTSDASLTLTVPNGLRVKLFLKLWSSLASSVGTIGSQFGLPPQIQAAIAMAGLYKGLDLKLNFRAPEVLPKGLRDKIF